MPSLIRSVGGPQMSIKCLSRFVIGWSKRWNDWTIRKWTWDCMGIPLSRDFFFLLCCTIFVWISILILEGMAGPTKHETSAWCHASRSVKQSNMVNDFSHRTALDFFFAGECDVDNCETCNATGSCISCVDGYEVQNGTCEGKCHYIVNQYISEWEKPFHMYNIFAVA